MNRPPAIESLAEWYIDWFAAKADWKTVMRMKWVLNSETGTQIDEDAAVIKEKFKTE
jgi:hypothetical protein